MPPDTPVTLPDASIVASEVVLLLQVPPAVASANEIVAPVHTLVGPVMAASVGDVFTVLQEAAHVEHLVRLGAGFPGRLVDERQPLEAVGRAGRNSQRRRPSSIG